MFELCQKLDQFTAEHNYNVNNTVMCSFKLARHFANVTIGEAIRIAMDALDGDKKIGPPPRLQKFVVELLLNGTMLTEIRFSFNGVWSNVSAN